MAEVWTKGLLLIVIPLGVSVTLDTRKVTPENYG